MKIDFPFSSFFPIFDFFFFSLLKTHVLTQSNSSLECSVLRVIIPNEYNGSIQSKTIPVRPHMTTRDVCRIIAHKSQITNPMDYGLFKLSDGEGKYLIKQVNTLTPLSFPCVTRFSSLWRCFFSLEFNDLFILSSLSSLLHVCSSFINLETLLMDNDCPQDIRLASSGAAKNSTLVFRRFDSKIAWPKQ